MRKLFIIYSLMAVLLIGLIAAYFPAILWSLLLVGPLILLGLYDYFQKEHAILRNFPLIGHFRYLFEAIRPEISQYFIEKESSEDPLAGTSVQSFINGLRRFSIPCRSEQSVMFTRSDTNG